MKVITEAFNYLDQLTHIKPDTKSRIKQVIKECEECYGDDTQSYTVYTCIDKKGMLVIEFSVNINDYVELINENNCY